jgi:RHS repeat-associated protein
VPRLSGDKPEQLGTLRDVELRAVSTTKTGFDAKSSVEDPAQRDARSTVYRNQDGTFTRRIYDQPVNVQRPDGGWDPADLTTTTAADGTATPKLAPYRITVTDRGVILDSLTLALRGTNRAHPQVTGSKVTFRNVLPGVDRTTTVTANGPAEEIILQSAQSPSTFEFDLRTNSLTPKLDEATGDIWFTEPAGAVRAVIAAAKMRDATGKEHPARYTLSKVDHGWRLTVAADPDWLRQSAFPVVINAASRIDSDQDDTYVTSGAAANHSGEIQLKAGKEAGSGISASYLHFSGLTSSLRNQYIVGAKLQLVNVGSGSCVPTPVDVFAVGAPWSGSTLTSWPGAPLAQHLAQRSFAHGNEQGCPAAVREGFDLPPDIVTDWTHGSPFHGLSVRAANESDPRAFKRFASFDVANDNKPYVDVVYSAQGAAYHVDEVTLPTANKEGRLKATVRNRGSATWTPGGPHKFGFIVRKGGTTVLTSGKTSVPRDTAPNASATFDVPMGALAPGDYEVLVTMYDGNTDYRTAYGVPQGAFTMKVVNVPPSVNYMQPGNGGVVDSLTPTLYAEGFDSDGWPNKGLRYNFKFCDGPADKPVNCGESGWQDAATWSPPAGRLRWSTTYHWWVQSHDTVNAGPFAGPIQLTTRVAQPEITSHLGGTPQGSPAPGLDPQVGNYGMASTDSAVATVGPDLTVTRTYNSLDPRTTTAFGQGWTSKLDTQLRADEDGSGNVVVTLPTGRQVRFGQNTDRTFAPPQGQNITLVLDTATGYYTLRDASGGSWQFNPWGRLRAITDPAGLVVELEYDVAGPTGKPKSLYNLSSKRRLYVTWTGEHVTAVRTDPPATGSPALQWNYTYDGHKLMSACAPGPAPDCTKYEYQTGSHYRSVVVDDNPRAYWRLGETNAGGGAQNVTARTPGADKGTYTGVALGGPGAIGGANDSAGAFDGAASRVDLPPKLISPTMSASVELWFRTTSGGVLISYADKPFGQAPSMYTPVLYVGQDGHLRGGFWVPKPDGQRQITSPNPVNDGQWHHAVLSGAINKQTLYLDGVAVPGTISGLIDHDRMPNMVVGTGRTAGWASGNNGDYFFAGSIDEVALYQHPLGATAVAAHHSASRSAEQLTKVVLPQDNRVAASLVYDTANDRVTTLTDHDGRNWRLDAPSRDGAVRKVTLNGPYPAYTYEFDADSGGRPTSTTQDDRKRKYTYNTVGFLAEETDENQHTSKFTTDARGNVLSRTTCRATNSCQTSYSTYFLDPAKPLDPRNDKKTSESDARSASPDDITFRTSFGYDTAGRLTSITHPKPNGVAGNPVETWKYAVGSEPADGGGSTPAGLLTEQTGKRPGQTTRYSYRATGDLAEQTTPGGLRTRYAYDGIGRKTSETPMSATGTAFGVTTYTYTPRSQVETVTGPAVRNTVSNTDHRLVTRYKYDANGNTTEVSQTDGAGADQARVTKHEYDGFDHRVATIAPDNTQTTWQYLRAGQEVRTVDARGITWTEHFDARNRLQRREVRGPGVDPADPQSTVLTVETRSYDAAGRLASVSDAMGRVTRYEYYDDDLLAKTIESDVVTEQREYDPAGNIVKMTEAGNRVTTSAFDPAGNVTTVTSDPTGLNRVTAYTRDADGQVLVETHSGGSEQGRVESVTYGYDAAGLLVREDVQPTPGDVLSTTYNRDERGLVVQQADRLRRVTDFTYDAYGRPVTATGPAVDTWVAGRQQTGVRPQTTTGYNTFGEATHMRDANSGVTVLGYDTTGRQTSMQLPDYTPLGGQVIRAVQRVEYDALGNPVKAIDALNRVTERGFDPYGGVISQTLPRVGDQPSTTTYGYDRNGELLSVTDPTGARKESTYDNRGRKITDTAVERKLPQTTYFTTTFGYDDADNMTTVTTPSNAVTRIKYNAAGEPVEVTDPTNRKASTTYDMRGRKSTTTDSVGVVTQNVYDLLGRPTATTQSTGNPPVEQRHWEQVFDPNDNLLSVKSPEGRSQSFAYDAHDRLVRQDEKVNASKTIRTSLGYDAAGNRTRFVDGNGRATDYTLTPWSLPESVTEPGQAKWTNGYDAGGQQVRSTAPGNVTTTSEYDAQGRMTVQRGTGAEAVTADKTFSYDPAGRLSSFGAPVGPSALTYDDRGNLLTVRGPSGDTTFTYNAESQIATRTDASGNSSFTYDAAGRPLTTVDGLSGRTISRTYDSAGRLATTTEGGFEQNVKRVATYDALGRLTGDNVTEFDPTGGAPRVILGTEYGYDRDDNITTKTTVANNQRTPNTYGYDGANRLISSNTTTYEWDDAGNRTRAGTQVFTYNDRNQLTSDGTTQYTYTSRGTLATAGTRTLQFDAFDQMTKDGVIGYKYDSLGRVATRGSTVFAYGSLANDPVSDGTRVIGRDPDGQPLSDKAVGSTETAKLLYADQHGDVAGRYRGLSSYGQRTFGPFGTVTASAGEQAGLGYQGEWTDPDTGAVNMHSRWYSPGTGTFLSRDTWTIPPQPSIAGNRYTYGDGDPMGNADPSGHCPVCVLPFIPGLPIAGMAAGTALMAGGLWIGSRAGDIADGIGRAWERVRPRDRVAGTATAAPGALIALRFRELANSLRDALTRAVARAASIAEIIMLRLKMEAAVEGATRAGGGRINTRGSNGGGSGSGSGGGGQVQPPPPPPPLWIINLLTAIPRAVAGATVAARPPTTQAADDNTTVVDNSDLYAEEANEVTEDLAAAGVGEDQIGQIRDQLDDQLDENEECLSGRGKSTRPHDYWPLADNRATGADACLNFYNDFKGSKPYSNIEGWSPGCGLQRGHLIACRFGGTGNKRNLIPITPTTNVPGMRTDFEACVANEMKSNKDERIFYVVIPVYKSDKSVDGVTMVAVGNEGYTRSKYIPNSTSYTKAGC